MEKDSLLCLLKGTLAMFFIALFSFLASAQTEIKPTVLTRATWKEYFTKQFRFKNCDTITIDITESDIPYPKKWWYAGDRDKTMKDKYLLYTLGEEADIVVMPSNNNIGTYLFYFNRNNPSKNFVAMNFVADSIKCQQLTRGVFMFQLNDDNFRIVGDSGGFKRYLFINAQGKICERAVVAHGCRFTENSADTTHSAVYFDVVFSNHPGFRKYFRLNYKSFQLLTTLDDVGDLNGNIIFDVVHYCYIKQLSAK